MRHVMGRLAVGATGAYTSTAALGGVLRIVTSADPATLPLSSTSSAFQTSPLVVLAFATVSVVKSPRAAPLTDQRHVDPVGMPPTADATRSSFVFGMSGVM